jgi:hypothetical protein
MPELSNAQIGILSRLDSLGFAIVAFPMYANYVGIRRNDCAALLAPNSSLGFRIFGEPSWLISGNLTVKITDTGRQFFVWKKTRIEATPDRLADLADFTRALSAVLAQGAPADG